MAIDSDAQAATAFHYASALLIDLDGTLVDSTEPMERAWRGFADRHGLDPEAVIHFAQGRPGWETIRLLAPAADQVAETALIDATEVADTSAVKAMPGALSILTSSRRLAIVTSCSLALLRARLAAAGLPGPPVMVTADDVTHGKPDPECYLLGARRLGVLPEQCVVLEDAPAGVAAGRAAGATVIGLTSTHPEEELGEADWVVGSLTALLHG